MTKERGVSASPIRRRPASSLAAVLLAALFVLAGCTGQQSTPGDYDGAKADFLEGCREIAESDADAGSAEATISSPDDYCDCVWAELTDPETGITFDRFKEINSDLTENGGPLPDDITEVYGRCEVGGQA
jgi:hypothetical protein